MSENVPIEQFEFIIMNNLSIIVVFSAFMYIRQLDVHLLLRQNLISGK